MGKSSDYLGQIKRENEKDKREKDVAEKTKAKLWKETIKASELAAFLSCYSRNQVHFDSKKVKGRIEEICSMSEGLLEKEDFRKEPGKNSMYLFVPETHGIILTLLDTEYFDDRKNDRLLSTRENLYRDLTVNVDLYMKPIDRDIVISNPAFANAKCESILSDAINHKIQELLRCVMHTDEVIRVKLLKRTYDKLCQIVSENDKEDTNLWSSKLVYSHTFDDVEDGKYLKALFGADNLFVFLINLLALRLKGKNYEMLSENEKLTYPALYAKAKTEEDPLWVELEDINIEDLMASQKDAVNLDEKYIDIIIKVSKILDSKDPDELQVLEDLISITQKRFIYKRMNNADKNISKRFYEASFAKDHFDLLNAFANGEFNTKTIHELHRINEVRNLHKND